MLIVINMKLKYKTPDLLFEIIYLYITSFKSIVKPYINKRSYLFFKNCIEREKKKIYKRLISKYT